MLRKNNRTLNEMLDVRNELLELYRRDLKTLARLAATAQFSNPLDVMRAKKLRDSYLQ